LFSHHFKMNHLEGECLHHDATLCSSKCWSSFSFETIDLADLDYLYQPLHQQQQQQEQQELQQQLEVQPQQQLYQQQQDEPPLCVLDEVDEEEIRRVLDVIKNDPIYQDVEMEWNDEEIREQKVEQLQEEEEEEEEVKILTCFEKPVYSDISDDDGDEDENVDVKKFKKASQYTNQLRLLAPTSVCLKQFVPQQIICVKTDCHYKSVGIDDFINHVKGHTVNDVELFQCNWKNCKFQTKLYSLLYQHKTRHTVEKSICGLWQFGCDFWAADLSDLGRHYNTYHARTKKPFFCSFLGCSASFGCENYLTKHMYIHVGKAPYFCGFRNCKTRSENLTSMLLHKFRGKHFETVEIENKYHN